MHSHHRGHRRRFARLERGFAEPVRRDHRDEHDPGGRGRRGGRRVFDHGDLRLVVLSLISERPRHGYELIKEIEDRVGGSYSPSPGVIYPTLTMLDELGHATVAEAGGKKLYAITDEGRAYLAANQTAVATVLARMSEISAAHGGGPAPQILRAVENLRLALRLRQSRGPLTEATLHAIVTALDTATVAIERS